MSEKDMIMELLEITQIQESGEVIFTDRSLEIIKELGVKYEQTALYRRARAENPDWEGDSNAGLLYVYMCERIAEAPSIIHMMMTPKLLLPILWKKLQEETGQIQDAKDRQEEDKAQEEYLKRYTQKQQEKRERKERKKCHQKMQGK